MQRCQGRAVEGSLELREAHNLNGEDKRGLAGFPLALEQAEVTYCLTQQFRCLGLRTKCQQEVKCLPQECLLCACATVHA